jgi:polar amino acid transport system substrate-binding protein
MKWRSLFITIYMVFLVPFAFADEIVLAADEWCPYNCAIGDKNPGFMLEIAKHAFEPHGHTVKYVIAPWARAILGTRKGDYTGIIAAGKEETPDFIFPGVSTGGAAHTFYVNQGIQWKYEGFESLKKIKLGVILDYSYGNLYNDYILPNKDQATQAIQIVSGANALSSNIGKLLNKRIDVLIEEKSVFLHHLMVHKIPNNFQEAGVAYQEDLYIAFSPKNEQSKKYAALLESGINDLRKTKQLEVILSKYGLKDWKKTE